MIGGICVCASSFVDVSGTCVCDSANYFIADGSGNCICNSSLKRV